MKVELKPDGVYVSVADPSEVICDFCSGQPVQWRYPTRDFLRTAGAVELWSRGDWAACNTCHVLIEAAAVSGYAIEPTRLLINRQAAAFGWTNEPEYIDSLWVNLGQFVANREGEAVLEAVPGEGTGTGTGAVLPVST